MKLSNIIYKTSKAHKVPSRVYTAILMQESSYRLSAKNCMKGLREVNPEKFKEDMVCEDYGISQIHYKTAKSYKMDITSLTENLEYSVDAGAKVLAWFYKTYSHKEPSMWYTRYNCGTHPNINRSTCNDYKRAVDRWM